MIEPDVSNYLQAPSSSQVCAPLFIYYVDVLFLRYTVELDTVPQCVTVYFYYTVSFEHLPILIRNDAINVI